MRDDSELISVYTGKVVDFNPTEEREGMPPRRDGTNHAKHEDAAVVGAWVLLGYCMVCEECQRGPMTPDIGGEEADMTFDEGGGLM